MMQELQDKQKSIRKQIVNDRSLNTSTNPVKHVQFAIGQDLLETEKHGLQIGVLGIANCQRPMLLKMKTVRHHFASILSILISCHVTSHAEKNC